MDPPLGRKSDEGTRWHCRADRGAAGGSEGNHRSRRISTGGLISAALLSVPGASHYFLGSAVVYTRDARRILMGIGDEEMKGIRSASEPYAKLLANRIRERFATHWGLSETGATGPTGNRYGDAAGHCCLAVAGAATHVTTLETGSNDR